MPERLLGPAHDAKEAYLCRGEQNRVYRAGCEIRGFPAAVERLPPYTAPAATRTRRGPVAEPVARPGDPGPFLRGERGDGGEEDR